MRWENGAGLDDRTTTTTYGRLELLICTGKCWMEHLCCRTEYEEKGDRGNAARRQCRAGSMLCMVGVGDHRPDICMKMQRRCQADKSLAFQTIRSGMLY